MMWDFILTTLVIVIFSESVLRAVEGHNLPRRREYIWVVLLCLVVIGHYLWSSGRFLVMPRFWQRGVYWIFIQELLQYIIRIGLGLIVIEFTARATGAILMAIRGIVTKVFGKDKK